MKIIESKWNSNHLFTAAPLTGVGEVEGGQLLLPGKNLFIFSLEEQPLQQVAVGEDDTENFELALQC